MQWDNYVCITLDNAPQCGFSRNTPALATWSYRRCDAVTGLWYCHLGHEKHAHRPGRRSARNQCLVRHDNLYLDAKEKPSMLRLIASAIIMLGVAVTKFG